MNNNEKYITLRNEACHKYDAAFHLLKVTFPLVNDPKLMIGIVGNILSSTTYAMEAILNYERQLQLVPHYLDNFTSKFNTFKLKCVRRNKIPMAMVMMISDLNDIMEAHKKSLVEFKKGNHLVICGCEDSYNLKTLSLEQVKEFLVLSRGFLQMTDRVLKI